MSNIARKSIAVAASVCILGVAYYGSYLPLQKSQRYIGVLSSKQQFGSLDDLTKTFSDPLDLYSPIGQEELVRNTASSILGFVQSSTSPEVVTALIDYIETYFAPIIERGRGMSFGQDLYIMGAMNEYAFVKTHHPKFFEAARRYYTAAFALGPNRPQALFGMFDILRFGGDVEGAKRIGEKILAQWPDDERTRKALAELLERGLTNKK